MTDSLTPLDSEDPASLQHVMANMSDSLRFMELDPTLGKPHDSKLIWLRAYRQAMTDMGQALKGMMAFSPMNAKDRVLAYGALIRTAECRAAAATMLIATIERNIREALTRDQTGDDHDWQLQDATEGRR